MQNADNLVTRYDMFCVCHSVQPYPFHHLNDVCCPIQWSKIAEFLPGRSGKQIRERFVNHLDPNLKKSEWTDDEEAILIGMHKHHGNKWTLISKNLPGRSDNDVKNHWYSTIARKFQMHGKDVSGCLTQQPGQSLFPFQF